MFARLFVPDISWFVYLGSIAIFSYSQAMNNDWYGLLIIPLSMVDRVLFEHYFKDWDEE